MSEEPPCKYVSDSCEPCPGCPRLMSALYRCGFLQDTLHQAEEEPEEKETT